MNNLVLYRKYRPQVFGDVVGQKHVVRTLRNALAQNKIAHAYLFAGPRGSGKTSLARILSKALNCLERGNSAEPCNVCSNCRDFNSGRSWDLIEIDAASNRGIEEIKNLRENARFGPTSGRYKVYLIDEAHMLTKEACNAFLKTLEEPPAHAVFILATTEAHRLLPTVVSRTQRFDFRRLSVDELSGRLATVSGKEGLTIDEPSLKLIAVEADGAARDAEGLLGQLVSTGEKNITLEKVEELLGLFSCRKVGQFVALVLSKDQPGIMTWLHQAAAGGGDMGQLLKSLKYYLRKMIMVGVSPDLAEIVRAELADDDFHVLESQAKKVPPEELARWLATLAEAKRNFEHYPLPQMALEVAFLSLLTHKPQPSPPGIHMTSQATGQTTNSKSEIPNKSQIPNSQKEEKQIAGYQLPIAKTPEPSNNNTLQLITANWDKILNEVRPFNHSLFGILQTVKPTGATASTLTLSAKYSFHRDRLKDPQNRKIIEDAVGKVVGRRLGLDCVLEG